MTIFLRQSTASQEVPLGRFVDSTDGNTEETALSIANTDIKIWKTGTTTLANKNSGGATHISGGEYYCVLDATDTDTIGPLKITIHVAGALYVQAFFCVLDEAVYDVLFGTTAISTLGGTAQTGDAFARLGAPAGASVSADIAAVKADLPVTITKNTAHNNFMFKMVDSTDHVTAETGVTVTATRSIDGAAFGACANSASEVSDGWYKINLAAGDVNGDEIVLRFTGTGCDATEFKIRTQPT